MHILSSVIDNCPSWISRRGRMAIEIISWSISMNVVWLSWGFNLWPLDLQSNMLWSPVKDLTMQTNLTVTVGHIVTWFLFSFHFYHHIAFHKGNQSSMCMKPNMEKRPLYYLRTAKNQMSVPIHAEKLDGFCLSTYTTVSIDSVSGQPRPWWACTNVQAHQGLCCPHIT